MPFTLETPALNAQKTAFKNQYNHIRQVTEKLCEPLETEDYLPQPITDVSPPKWHLAHTTWFFENFLLKAFENNFQPHHPKFSYLFNSYYQHEGERWQRQERGHLSRPTVKQIYKYRKDVDDRMNALMEQLPDDHWKEFRQITLLGLNHEQQHQELLIYDLKFILCQNPLWPVYNPMHNNIAHNRALPEDYTDFVAFDEGLIDVGFKGERFAFDNEKPVQKLFIHPFEMRKGLVTNKEYLKFMDSGGYETFKYWLDDGWNWLQSTDIESPLYWHYIDGHWMEMTLNGLQSLQLNAPVTHISYYEAEAFATWKGMRLPTEFEWEKAAGTMPGTMNGVNLQEAHIFHPVPATHHGNKLYQLIGDVWEWTNSNYLPYHGYQPAAGALGEYNGKFMANQMVLRGGSCATPADHLRITYRNFFHPDKRWAFSGIRLVKSLH